MVRARTAGAIALLVLAGGGWAAPAHAGAPSTTTLVLSDATTAYGDNTVTATAQVVTQGPADGDVVFTIDDVSVRANVSGSLARIALPRDATVGTHEVSASFVPRLPSQEPSTSAAVAWVISKSRTYMQVRVTGRGVRIPTSVVVAASGEYGTRPTGSVTVSVRHLGTGRTIRREKDLDAAGTVLARFGTLRAGGYRLRVSYAGDTQHLTERHSARFGVRQR